MVVSHKVQLPTEEDLTVQEVNLSTSALKAGAFHLGKYCELQNNEFMLCKQENQDPRICLDEGKTVTRCALSFFQEVKANCHKEFTQYANCLNVSSSDMRFHHCRKTQLVFDECVLNNMGVERPDFGYLTRIKVHKTSKPKPVDAPAVYPDAPDPQPPQNNSNPRANFGSRNII